MLPKAMPKHVEVLLGLSEVEFRQWQHNPITAAYLQFLDDMIAMWRDAAADLLEAGVFRLNDPSADRNPDVVRGRLLTLKELRRISVDEIQGFYREASGQSDEQA